MSLIVASSTPVHIRTEPEDRLPLLAATAIRAAAARRPDHVAVRELTRQGNVVSQTSYRTLIERMDRAGQAAVGALGLERGDNVAVLAPNCCAFLELVCGVSAAGVAVATLSPRLQSAEVSAIVADCGAKVVFVHPSCMPLAGELAEPRPKVIALHDSYEAFLAGASPEPLPPHLLADETDAFVLPYTSGTTGKPKSVVVSHRSRSICCHAMGVEYGCFGPDDRFLALAPLAHGAGFVTALACLYFGASCDLLDGFDAQATLRLLHRGEHSGVFFVPTHFQALFALGDDVLARYAGHGLKTIISNAAPLPQETKERIVAYFGEGLLHECYGSKEGGIVTNLRPQDQLRKQRCVGLPFPGTLVKLVDNAGKEVAPGEVGELLSRSPYNFSGYWNAPTETAGAPRHGWVSAGDLARADEEGYFYIVDRKKDMIISGGLNVYPREVEDVLNLPPSSAFVLLRSMVQIGCLHVDAATKGYFPTLLVTELGSWIPTTAYGLHQPRILIEKFRDATGETATLSVQNDLAMQVLDTAVGTQMIVLNVRAVDKHPLFTSNIGHVALSRRADADIAKLVARADNLGRNGMGNVDQPALMAAIDRVRRVGYESVIEGLGAIAWPIKTPHPPARWWSRWQVLRTASAQPRKVR